MSPKSLPSQAPKPAGIVRLKERGQVSIRLRLIGGSVTADDLAAVSEIARRYSGGKAHLTTRQAIEIAPVAEGDIEAACAELADRGFTLSRLGPCVRGIVACPGSACRNGVIDAQRMARLIDKAFVDFAGAHAKVKIAVAGCPNGCPKPAENDLGVMGVAQVMVDEDDCTGCGACETRCKVGAIVVGDEGVARIDASRCIECGGCAMVCPETAVIMRKTGYRLYAGGKMGRFPALGRVVAPWLDDEAQVIEAIERLLDFYRENGRKGERLGDCLMRVGEVPS
jgi:dissimilatory sulfite reductase (desulfoviridin) alpha/beta subunit